MLDQIIERTVFESNPQIMLQGVRFLALTVKYDQSQPDQDCLIGRCYETCIEILKDFTQCSNFESLTLQPDTLDSKLFRLAMHKTRLGVSKILFGHKLYTTIEWPITSLPLQFVLGVFD